MERRYTRKVPIRVALAGDPPAGYKILGSKATPSIVDVTGPRTLVRGLADVPTEPIDLSELRESRTLNVPLSLSSRALSVGANTTVQVAMNVEALLADRHFPEAPVSVDRRGWRANAGSVHVTLSGPVAELDRMDASKVRVVVHLPEPEPASKARITELGSKPGQIEVVLPEGTGIKIKRLDPDTIQLEREP